MMQVIGRSFPIARKQHRCMACGRIIEPGEKYERQRNIGSDGPYVWKECQHCRPVIERIWRTADSYDLDDGLDLSEWLYEFPGDTIHDLRITVQFRRQWRDRNGLMYPVPSWPAQPENIGAAS